MAPPDITQTDRITGDWLDDIGRDFYPGIIIDGWSGGVVWLATREVAEMVVADQLKLDDGSDPQIDRLFFDGDTLVWLWPVGSGPTPSDVVIDGRPAMLFHPTADGRYEMPHWAWTRA